MKIGENLLYLSEADVYATGTTMKQHIDAVEQALVMLHKGQAQLPEVSAIEFPNGSAIHAMPSYLEPIGAVGQKWMTVFWQNPARGLSYLQGLVILSDPDTGIPICVMDAKSVTGLRTAAMNGVGARYLANNDAKTCGVIAVGLQGRTNLDAMLTAVPSLEEVWAWGPTPAKVDAYCADMSAQYGIPVRAGRDAEDVIRRADVLAITAPGLNMLGDSARMIDVGWVKPGCAILPLNQDAYFKHGVLPDICDRIFIDDPRKWNTMLPQGSYAGVEGVPPTIGSLIAGDVPGRQSHDEVIAFFHLGVGLLDVASGYLIYQTALEKGVGTLLPL